MVVLLLLLCHVFGLLMKRGCPAAAAVSRFLWLSCCCCCVTFSVVVLLLLLCHVFCGEYVTFLGTTWGLLGDYSGTTGGLLGDYLFVVDIRWRTATSPYEPQLGRVSCAGEARLFLLWKAEAGAREGVSRPCSLVGAATRPRPPAPGPGDCPVTGCID